MENEKLIERPAEDKTKAAIESLKDIGGVMKNFAESFDDPEMLKVANGVLEYAAGIVEFSPDQAKKSRELTELASFILREKEVRNIELSLIEDVRDQLVKTIEGEPEELIPEHHVGFKPSDKISKYVKRIPGFISDLKEVKDEKKSKTGKIGF